MRPAIEHDRSDSSNEQNHVADALRNLQHVMAQCRDAVFITDPAGVLSRVNPAFEDLTGYLPLELVGKDFSTIIAGGAEAESYRRIWTDVFQQRAFSGVVEIAQKCGDIRRIEVTITPVRNNRGRVASLVGTGRVETTPPEALSTETGTDPAASFEIAHSLNNALMVIAAHAELAVSALPAGHALCGNLQEIADTSRRAASLGRDLLESTRRQKQAQALIGLEETPVGKSKILPESLAKDLSSVRQIPELPFLPSGEKSPHPSRTLLIVEDEALIRESTAEFLSRAGYRVLAAASAEDATLKLQSHSGAIDLVITDVVLPRMSGQQLAQKAALSHPEARILFISGYAETAVLRKASTDPAMHFLQKPFSLRALAEKIQELLATPERSRAAGAAS